MNKIYRIIWSKVKHGWIVVSEIAKRCGKAGSQTVRAAVGSTKGATGNGGLMGTGNCLAGQVVSSLLLAAVLAVSCGQQAAWAETKNEPIIYAQAVSVDGSDGTGSAFGSLTKASGEYATAFGCVTAASGHSSTAFGYNARASGAQATAFGFNTRAIGTQATAFGYVTTASGTSSTAFGFNTMAIGIQATAFGDGTTASGTSSTAFGSNSKAGIWLYGNEEARIVSYENESGETRYKIVKASDGSDLDNNNGAGYDREYEASQNLIVKGRASTAFGIESKAYADNSLAALGGYTEIDATNSAAIGNGAKASLADTVALGSGAVANRAAGAQGYSPDGKTYSGNAWVSTHNAIAVGASENNSDAATVTRQITGVAAGTFDTDAVNVAQLKAVEQGMAVTVKGANGIEVTQSADKSTYTVNAKLSDNLTVRGDGNIDLADVVKVGNGADAKTVTIDGTVGEVTGLTNTTWSKDGVYNAGRAATEEQLMDLYEAVAEAAKDGVENEGLAFAGDTGTSDKIKLGDTLNLKGGATGALSDGNIGVEAEGTALNIKLAKDIRDVDSIQVNKALQVGDTISLDGNAGSVKVGGTTLDGSGLTIADGPSVTKDGIDARNKKITNVAAGTNDTDAVNVSQLKALEQQATDNDVMLNNRINKVGAGAAALAALHPLDTDDKFSMGLGYGNYRDAHAGAIGLFYRPTDKVMLSVAGSMGNGENMINAGITFALDKGKGFGTSKAAMARKINQQENQIQALQIENAKLAERLAAIEAKLAK